MLQLSDTIIPAYYEDLIKHVESENDREILMCEGFLKANGTQEVRKNTSVATLRTTIHLRSQNTSEPKSVVKDVLVRYWTLCYGYAGVLFYQSQLERRSSQEDVMYFHAICFINRDDYERVANERQG